MRSDTDQTDIDEDSCLALTGDAEQCGNGIHTDASDPEEGLCGVHAGSDRPKVSKFGPAWKGVRDDLVELLRNERDAYALATISPDLDELWERITGLEDIQVGDHEIAARRLCYLAREVAQHEALDVEDHPLGYNSCVALQGRSAKNHSCPNSAYGAGLLCGMHQEADLPGTILDEDEPGPNLETVTVDEIEYQLVEQRDEDLIVVDPREWELKRLEGAAGDETRWDDPATTPDLSDDLDTLVLASAEVADSDHLRNYAEQNADEWAILSPKYGLLDPEAEIEPHGLSIEDVDVREWNLTVLRDLPDVDGMEVVILAGPDYVDELEGDLFMYGAEVSIPVESIEVSKHKQWLFGQIIDDKSDDRPAEDAASSEDHEPDAAARTPGNHAGEATADGGTEPTVRPEPPASLPKYIITGVEKQSPEDLRDLAEYAERMANWFEAEAQREMEERAAEQEPMETPEEWDDDEWQDAVEEARDDADLDGGKGTLTTKTIDGRDYYYLQWREGSNIKSEYVAPVVPADSEE
jgi:hypothetical protein